MQWAHFHPRAEHLEGSYGAKAPDMVKLATVGGMLEQYEAFEEQNRVERWERLCVVVQELLDGLNVCVFFQSETMPIIHKGRHFSNLPHPPPK